MTNEPQSQLLLYQTSDGATRLEVRLENETVWLSQSQMAELFQTSIPNVSMHIRNVFAEGELQQAATVKEFLIVRQEGSRQVTRSVEHLQPGCHHFRRLPGEVASRHAVPHLGDAAVAGIHRQGIRTG